MIRRILQVTLLGVALLATTTAGPARADLIGYASAVGGGIYSVDLTTATAALLGNSGVNLMEALAISSTGTLYGTDDGGNLYTLSTTTGAVTRTIGFTGLGDVEGLAFQGGRLLATNFDNFATNLYSLNTSTAAATLVAPTTPAIGLVRDLTFSGTATTGYLINGSTGSQSLYSITASGVTTQIGAAQTSSGFSAALGSDSAGNLYSLDSLGYAYSVSTTTGAFTQIGNTGNHFYLGLAIPATSAVPEPSSLALCGVAGGLGLLASRRRWR